MAELLGTFFIVLLGCGVNAMNTLFNLGGYTDVTLGWGAAVFLGILMSNRISGAHLNPAVTLSLVVTKRFPANKMLHYIAGQMLGGFLGAALVYYFYKAKFAMVNPNLLHTSAIFATFPAAQNFIPSFMAEFIATAILLFGILAIVEHFATEKAGWLAAFAIGALIVSIGMSLGGMHGYAMNHARDLSPRIFTALMGFHDTGFQNPSAWLPPIIGSLLGGPVGAVLYNLTIGNRPTFYRTDAQAYKQETGKTVS